MAVNLDEYLVHEEESDTWSFTCPVTDGSCGDGGNPFSSSGWPSKKVARARLDEHVAEHKGEGAMSTLEEFRAKHGLAVDADGVVTAKDL